MLRQSLLFLSQNTLSRRIATEAPFARAFARRFVAGETLDQAVVAARECNERDMLVSLDYLGESVRSRAEARQAAETGLRIVNRIAADGLRANISVKLTQLGQDIDQQFLYDNVVPILEAAERNECFIRFDMESSEYTQSTLDFFERLWQEGRRTVGVVLQSYLYRTEEDVRRMNELGARVRLCKGAYQEPPSVAYQEKSEVDANFVRCMRLLLSDGNYPGIATHDPAMLAATREYAAAREIPVERYEFQMLYGVRRDYQQTLVDDGFNLRVYIPFGEAWYPYFMRRMAERPANFFFIVGSVVRESPFGFLLGRRNGARR